MTDAVFLSEISVVAEAPIATLLAAPIPSAAEVSRVIGIGGALGSADASSAGIKRDMRRVPARCSQVKAADRAHTSPGGTWLRLP